MVKGDLRTWKRLSKRCHAQAESDATMKTMLKQAKDQIFTETRRLFIDDVAGFKAFTVESVSSQSRRETSLEQIYPIWAAMSDLEKGRYMQEPIKGAIKKHHWLGLTSQEVKKYGTSSDVLNHRSAWLKWVKDYSQRVKSIEARKAPSL